MIYIQELKVRSLSLDALTVTWEVEIDPEEDILDYEMFVLRSESPTDDFEAASPGLFDVYEFADRDVCTRSKWRKMNYKIRVRHIPSGREFFSEVQSAYRPSGNTLLGLEIARRNEILLYGPNRQSGMRFTGIECWWLKRKTFGPVCGHCYSTLKRQVVRSDCESCYKVGKDGGYFPPVRVNFQIEPHAQTVDHANISEQQPAETRMWTSNWPELSPGDVIVEPGNKRWRIRSVSTTEQFRVIVRQIAQAYYIDPGEVIYRYEIEE
jgi:hypothetical protein